jgi:hypothetical protein
MLLNMTQYAAHRGVSKMAVSKAVKAGRIQCVDGKIDRDAADAAWTRNTRVNPSNEKAATREVPVARHEVRTRPSGEQGPTPGTLAHAQLVKETAQAKKAALEVQRIEGKLVEVEEVRRMWERHVDAVKNRLLLLESKVPPECRALVAKEVRSALNELSEYRDAA